MKIIYNIFNTKNPIEKAYIAIGSFDGIHLGHKKLITDTVSKAINNGGKSVVFTFLNHPLEIVKKDIELKFLTTIEEKINIFDGFNIDYLVLQPFTQEFADIEPYDFVKLLKDQLGAKEFFVGFNFSYGKNGLGTVDTLKTCSNDLGIDLTIIPPVRLNNITISSTLIRNLVSQGKIKEANQYLGYNFFISGTVVHGEKIARQLGFPTANLELKNKIVPKFGVYGGLATVENDPITKSCIVNIGNNPTLKAGIQTFEAHIFNYDSDIYGKNIKVQLLDFIRPEKKFESVDNLIDAIKEDVRSWKSSYNI
ncbi:MAG: bifunctional riboflavin kinase/FAD synthetase [Fusobacteriaceae bacterium]|jgi:riboflavin kinase/FMN adenylyltransferase|nr:bifunctional riboflavin kinase/FAD synthetase [Fusobacteriaceae bacterium]